MSDSHVTVTSSIPEWTGRTTLLSDENGLIYKHGKKLGICPDCSKHFWEPLAFRQCGATWGRASEERWILFRICLLEQRANEASLADCKSWLGQIFNNRDRQSFYLTYGRDPKLPMNLVPQNRMLVPETFWCEVIRLSLECTGKNRWCRACASSIGGNNIFCSRRANGDDCRIAQCSWLAEQQPNPTRALDGEQYEGMNNQ
jgi:hypothetical protein